MQRLFFSQKPPESLSVQVQLKPTNGDVVNFIMDEWKPDHSKAGLERTLGT